MEKNDILTYLWNNLESTNFIQQYFKQYAEAAKNAFFKNGMKKQKKQLQQICNLYDYGYYHNRNQYIYYDITD